MERRFSLKEARKATQSIVRREKVKIPVPEVKTEAQEPVEKGNQVSPAKIIHPCPPTPPPVQSVDVLKVLKVFQECRVVDVNEIVDVVAAPVGAVDVVCLGAELIEDPVCVINPFDNTVTATFSFVTAYQFVDEDGDPVGNVQVIETLDEVRSVFLSRAGEPGLRCQADVFLECIQCFVSGVGPTGLITEVTCCVGKQILFKLIAEVQLLVPTLGYAPEPPECEQVAGQCPDFTPVWPPYPPQSPDFPPLQKKGCSCGKKA